MTLWYIEYLDYRAIVPYHVALGEGWVIYRHLSVKARQMQPFMWNSLKKRPPWWSPFTPLRHRHLSHPCDSGKICCIDVI